MNGTKRRLVRAAVGALVVVAASVAGWRYHKAEEAKVRAAYLHNAVFVPSPPSTLE
jgi:hypothetical protein